MTIPAYIKQRFTKFLISIIAKNWSSDEVVLSLIVFLEPKCELINFPGLLQLHSPWKLLKEGDCLLKAAYKNDIL